jgi:glutamyl aminopeptidase
MCCDAVNSSPVAPWLQRDTDDSPAAGLTTVEFRKSVPMVTYLTCFIVSDFERLSPVTVSQGFPFSVYSTPAQVNKTKYALEVGVKIIEYYIQYFGIPYPLPKLGEYFSRFYTHTHTHTHTQQHALYNLFSKEISDARHNINTASGGPSTG